MGKSVIAVVDDLFFASKIRGTAEQLGIEVHFAKTVAEAVRQAIAKTPELVIVDLHSQRCDPIEVAASLKSHDETKSIPLLGFFSHVQTELQRQAEHAGFDRVIARSAFANHLSKILAGQ